MSSFTYNVAERVAELTAVEAAQVLVWVSELRLETLRQKAQHEVGTEVHMMCDDNLVELDALLVALRAR